MIGGIVTILAVLAILAYAVLRQSGTSTAARLSDPQTLNPAAQQLAVGQKAPDFALRDASGKSYSLAAQQGHPVVLEFFAVWYPMCHAEAPAIARLTKDFVPKGVRVWSVLANPYGKNYELSGKTDLSLATKADLTWYAQEYNVHHPQLVDPNFQTVNQYGINDYPGLYIIDGKGVIRYSSAGQRPYTVLARQLRTLLGSHGG